MLDNFHALSWWWNIEKHVVTKPTVQVVMEETSE
jgi:hypothetical protein